jgi:hypothetical protein
MTTNQKISLAILAKMAEGLTLEHAIDAVLGVGTYQTVAGDIYDALRK